MFWNHFFVLSDQTELMDSALFTRTTSLYLTWSIPATYLRDRLQRQNTGTATRPNLQISSSFHSSLPLHYDPQLSQSQFTFTSSPSPSIPPPRSIDAFRPIEIPPAWQPLPLVQTPPWRIVIGCLANLHLSGPIITHPLFLPPRFSLAQPSSHQLSQTCMCIGLTITS